MKQLVCIHYRILGRLVDDVGPTKAPAIELAGKAPKLGATKELVHGCFCKGFGANVEEGATLVPPGNVGKAVVRQNVVENLWKGGLLRWTR